MAAACGVPNGYCCLCHKAAARFMATHAFIAKYTRTHTHSHTHTRCAARCRMLQPSLSVRLRPWKLVKHTHTYSHRRYSRWHSHTHTHTCTHARTHSLALPCALCALSRLTSALTLSHTAPPLTVSGSGHTLSACLPASMCVFVCSCACQFRLCVCVSFVIFALVNTFCLAFKQ